jgi:VanZ family protein
MTKRINNKVTFKILAVIAWMVLIFLLSGNLGSKSGSLSAGTIGTIRAYLPSLSEQLATLLARKSAHILMYAVLGILLTSLLREYKLGRRAVVAYALVVAALYASLDEINQYFVGGRSSSPRDVAIDVLGAAAGIAIYFAVIKIARFYTSKKTKNIVQ